MLSMFSVPNENRWLLQWGCVYQHLLSLEKCHNFERFQWKVAINKLGAFPQSNILFRSGDHFPLLLLKNVLLFIQCALLAENRESSDAS